MTCPRCHHDAPTIPLPTGLLQLADHDREPGRLCSGTGLVVEAPEPGSLQDGAARELRELRAEVERLTGNLRSLGDTFIAERGMRLEREAEIARLREENDAFDAGRQAQIAGWMEECAGLRGIVEAVANNADALTPLDEPAPRDPEAHALWTLGRMARAWVEARKPVEPPSIGRFAADGTGEIVPAPAGRAPLQSRTCPRCGGIGRVNNAVCKACGGEGTEL
jgi:hypothetical protein